MGRAVGRWGTFSPTGERALEQAIDLLAVARLTRLVTSDTFPPVRALRDRVLARWPAPGQPLDERQLATAAMSAVDGSAFIRPDVAGDGRYGPIHEEDDEQPDGRYDRVWVWTEGTPVGELVTCPWCASVWLGAGVVLARWLAPGLWSPVARALAASEIAGLAAEATA